MAWKKPAAICLIVALCIACVVRSFIYFPDPELVAIGERSSSKNLSIEKVVDLCKHLPYRRPKTLNGSLYVYRKRDRGFIFTIRGMEKLIVEFRDGTATKYRVEHRNAVL